MVLFSSLRLYPSVIEGSCSIELKGPVTEEIASEARSGALGVYKLSLLQWLREGLFLDWDTVNAIDRIHFNRLAEFCLDKAKRDTRFEGYKWSVSYKSTPDEINVILSDWNDRHEKASAESYQLFADAMTKNDMGQAYTFGIQSVFYAKGKKGQPVMFPGGTEKVLLEEAVLSLQKLFGRMKINSTELVITGKPDFPPQNQPVLTCVVDSVPLSGVTIRIQLPNGRHVYTSVSDAAGELPLNRMVVPYVANGSFLYALPNPGAVIDPAYYFTFKDMGVVLSANPEQTFIVKVTRPTFSLAYRAVAASNLSLPRDFTENTVVYKFLRDSCHLEPAAAPANADLSFDVVCQVSTYAHDVTEETVLKSEMLIGLDKRKVQPSRSTRKTFFFEKAHDTRSEVPIGLFLWETATELRKNLRSVLEEL